MRAVQFALLVIVVQVSLGLIAVSGLFGDIYYDNALIPTDDGTEFDIGSEEEQNQFSFDGFRTNVKDIISWGWIKGIAMPWYETNESVKTIVDGVILFLRGITIFLVTVAFFEFIRNRVESL